MKLPGVAPCELAAYTAPCNGLLLQVVDDLPGCGHQAEGSLLPALRRRNSGKRNLHKPWTEVEEAELVRLVEHADYRKQVRLSPIVQLVPMTIIQKYYHYIVVQ